MDGGFEKKTVGSYRRDNVQAGDTEKKVGNGILIYTLRDDSSCEGLYESNNFPCSLQTESWCTALLSPEPAANLSRSLGVFSCRSAPFPGQSGRQATIRGRMAKSIDCPGRGGSPAQAREQLACCCSKEDFAWTPSTQRSASTLHFCRDSLRGNVEGGSQRSSSTVRLCPRAIPPTSASYMVDNIELSRTG